MLGIKKINKNQNWYLLGDKMIGPSSRVLANSMDLWTHMCGIYGVSNKHTAIIISSITLRSLKKVNYNYKNIGVLKAGYLMVIVKITMQVNGWERQVLEKKCSLIVFFVKVKTCRLKQRVC